MCCQSNDSSENVANWGCSDWSHKVRDLFKLECADPYDAHVVSYKNSFYSSDNFQYI